MEKDVFSKKTAKNRIFIWLNLFIYEQDEVVILGKEPMLTEFEKYIKRFIIVTKLETLLIL